MEEISGVACYYWNYAELCQGTSHYLKDQENLIGALLPILRVILALEWMGASVALVEINCANRGPTLATLLRTILYGEDPSTAVRAVQFTRPAFNPTQHDLEKKVYPLCAAFAEHVAQASAIGGKSGVASKLIREAFLPEGTVYTSYDTGKKHDI